MIIQSFIDLDTRWLENRFLSNALVSSLLHKGSIHLIIMVIGCLNWPLLALHLKQLWHSTYPQKSLGEILRIRGLAEISEILGPIPPKEMTHWILRFDRWCRLPKWSSLFKNLALTGRQYQVFLTCDVTCLALQGVNSLTT